MYLLAFQTTDSENCVQNPQALTLQKKSQHAQTFIDGYAYQRAYGRKVQNHRPVHLILLCENSTTLVRRSLV